MSICLFYQNLSYVWIDLPKATKKFVLKLFLSEILRVDQIFSEESSVAVGLMLKVEQLSLYLWLQTNYVYPQRLICLDRY